MSTQAKFFCENCHSEVKSNARFCPTCGKFFSSVKCPMCGAVGTSQQFKEGCPKCGYAEGKTNQNNTGSSPKSSINNNADGKSFKGRGFSGAKTGGLKRLFSSRSDDSLPAWIYLVAIGLLVGIVTIFIVGF